MNVGDKVILFVNGRPPEPARVGRVTPSGQVVVDGMRFHPLSLAQVGRKKHARIRPYTEEAYERALADHRSQEQAEAAERARRAARVKAIDDREQRQLAAAREHFAPSTVVECAKRVLRLDGHRVYTISFDRLGISYTVCVLCRDGEDGVLYRASWVGRMCSGWSTFSGSEAPSDGDALVEAVAHAAFDDIE